MAKPTYAAQRRVEEQRLVYYLDAADASYWDQHWKTYLSPKSYTAADSCGAAIMALDEPLLGKIYGVKMFRTAAVRPLGFYPLEEKGWDRRALRRLMEAGYDITYLRESAGQHHPVYLPHEAFWKFRFIGEKARHYGTGLDSFGKHVDSLADYWQRTHEVIGLYALAGLFDGLQAEDIRQPLCYENREQYRAFLKVKAFLEGFPGR